MSGRLVVLRALGLGDLLTAVPALRALAGAFPDHRRILATPGWLAPLATLDGLVHDVVPVDLRAGDGPAPETPLPASLAGADVAVNLHGAGPQSTRLLAATRPERLIAYRHPELPSAAEGPVWRGDEHEVLRWCRLLRHAGIPTDPDRLDLAVPPDPAAAGATLIHPGAASPARRWPAERWVAVARAEAAAGRRVLVTGSRDEAQLAGAVAAAAGLEPAAVLAGRTDVLGLARVVAAAARILCADTGVAHIATATRTPSVVLFGPTPPSAWGPPPDRREHRVLWRGHVGDPHASALDPGLEAITVDAVLVALAGLPDRQIVPER